MFAELADDPPTASSENVETRTPEYVRSSVLSMLCSRCRATENPDPVHLHASEVLDVAQRDQRLGSVHLPQLDGIGGVPPIAGEVDGA